MRTFKMKNMAIEESIIGLVQINYKSPTHFGFFKEN
jgi:hypothetical protein